MLILKWNKEEKRVLKGKQLLKERHYFTTRNDAFFLVSKHIMVNIIK